MRAAAVLTLLTLLTLACVSNQDDLEPILGRPWQPIKPVHKAKLQARFVQNLNQMLTDCYRNEKEHVCRQKMMDVPLDMVYRVHPNRW